MSRSASTFSTAPVVQDSSRPMLRSADLCASYQWPFHLRIHPDRWEYVGGSWRLEIERVQLRPGVGGVSGKERDLKSIRDTRLMSGWAIEGDRKWVILPNGDKRLTAVFPRRDATEEDGLFLDSMEVSVVENGRLREGSIQLARWENVDGEGNIVSDAAELAHISKALAVTVWGMSGPSAAARAKVTKGLRRLYDQLEETASRRPQGGSPSLRRRIDRLRTNLHEITGEAQFAPKPGDVLAPAPRLAPMVISNAEPAFMDQRAAAMSYLAGLPPEELHRMLTSTGAAATSPPAAFSDTPPAVRAEPASAPPPPPVVAPTPPEAEPTPTFLATPRASEPRPPRTSTKSTSALPPIPGMETPRG